MIAGSTGSEDPPWKTARVGHPAKPTNDVGKTEGEERFFASLRMTAKGKGSASRKEKSRSLTSFRMTSGEGRAEGRRSKARGKGAARGRRCALAVVSELKLRLPKNHLPDLMIAGSTGSEDPPLKNARVGTRRQKRQAAKAKRDSSLRSE
jgi:hypothetical protein